MSCRIFVHSREPQCRCEGSSSRQVLNHRVGLQDVYVKGRARRNPRESQGWRYRNVVLCIREGGNDRGLQSKPPR